MKTIVKRISACLITALLLALLVFPLTAFAARGETAAPAASETLEEEESQDNSTGTKAIAAAVAIAVAAAAGAVSMGIAIAKSADSISRQPEAADKIRTSLTLGLVFIETAIIYALIIAILIIFVL